MRRTWLAAAMVLVGLVGCSSRSEPKSPQKSPATTRAEPATEGVALGPAASATPAEAGFAKAEFKSSAPAPRPKRARTTGETPTSGPAPAADDSSLGSPAGLASDAPADPTSRAEPPVPSRNRGIQSGTLTAGSFDDHERFEAYREFLSASMQNDPSESLPRISLGRRAIIRVTSEQGKPVPDARVVVRPAGQDQASPLLDAVTASDGRTMFLTGVDGGEGAAEFRVEVSPPGGGKPEVRTMNLDQSVWNVQLAASSDPALARLDLALVVDTTGSMSDELEYLKVEIDSIAQSVRRMFPNVDQRYALIVYRDQGDEYVVRTFDFTSSLPDFRRSLAQQRAVGGGDYPEAVHAALEQANKLNWRDGGTARVLFWVADAPPHREFAARAVESIAGLRKRTVRMFPVAGSGAAHQAEFVMRAAAFLTQGQYLFLTDHSGVGNPHETPHVPDYVVERLDRLMIRMIASELAGRKLAAEEIIAIEGGQSPSAPPGPVPVDQQGSARAVPHTSAGPLSWIASVWSGSWIPHWTILLAILAGKVAIDIVGERRGRR